MSWRIPKLSRIYEFGAINIFKFSVEYYLHTLQIKNENLNYQETLGGGGYHRSRCRREFEKINFAGGGWGRAEGQSINGNH